MLNHYIGVIVAGECECHITGSICVQFINTGFIVKYDFCHIGCRGLHGKAVVLNTIGCYIIFEVEHLGAFANPIFGLQRNVDVLYPVIYVKQHIATHTIIIYKYLQIEIFGGEHCKSKVHCAHTVDNFCTVNRYIVVVTLDFHTVVVHEAHFKAIEIGIGGSEFCHSCNIIAHINIGHRACFGTLNRLTVYGGNCGIIYSLLYNNLNFNALCCVIFTCEHQGGCTLLHRCNNVFCTCIVGFNQHRRGIERG